jgi:hypothetical protein
MNWKVQWTNGKKLQRLVLIVEQQIRRCWLNLMESSLKSWRKSNWNASLLVVMELLLKGMPHPIHLLILQNCLIWKHIVKLEKVKPAVSSCLDKRQVAIMVARRERRKKETKGNQWPVARAKITTNVLIVTYAARKWELIILRGIEEAGYALKNELICDKYLLYYFSMTNLGRIWSWVNLGRSEPG